MASILRQLGPTNITEWEREEKFISPEQKYSIHWPVLLIRPFDKFLWQSQHCGGSLKPTQNIYAKSLIDTKPHTPTDVNTLRNLCLYKHTEHQSMNWGLYKGWNFTSLDILTRISHTKPALHLHVSFPIVKECNSFWSICTNFFLSF